MDNILDKFGLYDFFGLLLPGMFFILVMDLLGIPQELGIMYPTNEAIMVVAFVLFSYVIGTLIQELASLFDKHVTHMREEAMRKYLSDEKEGHFTDTELKTVKKLIELKVDCKERNISEEECKTAFFKFKAYLENNEKMEKANKLDAMFAMSRDLFVCNVVIIICTVIDGVWNRTFKFMYIVVILYFVVSSFMLLKRASRYAKMRVRTIIRQYISLVEENISVNDTAEENISEE